MWDTLLEEASRKMPPNPETIFSTAEAFRLGTGALSAHLPNLMFSWVMCASFSSELYLKCLVLVEGGNYGKDHDLKMLFERLTRDSQENIRKRYEPKRAAEDARHAAANLPARPRTDFDYKLEVSSKAFVKFRYAYEGLVGPVGWGNSLIDECVRERIIELRPDWKNPLR